MDYIKTHNDKFADSTNYTLNAFKSAKDFDLNVVFAKRYIRKTDHCVKVINAYCKYSLGYTPKSRNPWKNSFSQYSENKNNQNNIKPLY